MRNLADTLKISDPGVHVLAGAVGDRLTTTTMHLALEMASKLETPTEGQKRPAIIYFSRDLGAHELMQRTAEDGNYPFVLNRIHEKKTDMIFFNTYDRVLKDLEHDILTVANDYNIKAIITDAIVSLRGDEQSKTLSDTILFLHAMKKQYNVPVIAGIRLNLAQAKTLIHVHDEIRSAAKLSHYTDVDTALRFMSHHELLDIHFSKSRELGGQPPLTINAQKEYTFTAEEF